MGWETSEAGGFELGPMIHTSPSPPDLGGTRGSVQQWAEHSHDRVKRLSHIVHQILSPLLTLGVPFHLCRILICYMFGM